MRTRVGKTSGNTNDATSAEWRKWAALGVLCLAVVLLAVDGTVLSLAVPALTAALQPSSTQLLWIGDAYSFALAGLLVTMGSLGDRIGRKRLLLIGAAGFGAASVLAAYAPSAEWLIAARALLGVAGATLMPSTLSLIRDIFPDGRQRTKAIALWAATATVGAAVGPLVGGALLEHFWWGSVFIINAPVMILLLALGVRLLPESRDPNPGPFDPLSALLALVGVVPLVFAIKELAADGGLGAAAGAGVLGVSGLVLFVRRQRHLATPMIDMTLFGRPAFTGAVLVNMLSIFALAGLLFFVSQYLQLVRGYGPLEAGLAQLPSTIGTIAVSFLVGVLLRRVARNRLVGGGLLLTAAGLVLLAVGEQASSYLPFAAALAMVGVGVGFALTLTTDAVVSAVPRDKAGAASAVSETAYELGVAMGVALLGSVLTLAYRSGLNLPAQLPATVRAAAEDSLAALAGLAPTTPVAAGLLDAARTAFVTAMQLTSVLAAVLMAASAVLALRLLPADRGDAATAAAHHN